MYPSSNLKTIINGSKVSFKNNYITFQYNINSDIYQITGPSYEKKLIHFINKNGLWLEE